MAFYIDTSALVKLVIDEPETEALWAWMTDTRRRFLTSKLTEIETSRAVGRWAPDQAEAARQTLIPVVVVDISDVICAAAERITPPKLRSLDAIHLVTALELGEDLDGIITYDHRLASAAAAHNVTVIAPA